MATFIPLASDEIIDLELVEQNLRTYMKAFILKMKSETMYSNVFFCIKC